MSLCPCFIKCTDGKWYKNLAYNSESNLWFICFDEDEPVELVMRESCRTAPHVILRDLGIKTKKMEGHGFGADRWFGRRFFRSKSFFLETHNNKPFPAPRPWDTHDGVFDKNPNQEGTYFGGGL